MNSTIKTGLIRAFVPAKDFIQEKNFYLDLGFDLGYDDGELAVFQRGDYSFYLQDYYVEDWANNCMLFMEVDDVDAWYQFILEQKLSDKYPGIRFADPVDEFWGRVCRIVTPTGVLWHFGKFKSSS